MLAADPRPSFAGFESARPFADSDRVVMVTAPATDDHGRRAARGAAVGEHSGCSPSPGTVAQLAQAVAEQVAQLR
jgi:hypothetical protein